MKLIKKKKKINRKEEEAVQPAQRWPRPNCVATQQCWRGPNQPVGLL
jgi:hypothetical protein